MAADYSCDKCSGKLTNSEFCYNGIKFGDGLYDRWDLCNPCLRKAIKSFRSWLESD